LLGRSSHRRLPTLCSYSAKKEWSDELAPTGRKLYPHWSRLMSLEELYGLPKTDYIDKKAGLAGEEDAEKIRQLRTDMKRFTKK
uniref:39S ribosomal protein L52, mitochondrial n=1 Tax=Heligmosomoides polygyrus TaxID=6339 RepID=A0A183FCN0_HELPZ